MDRSPRIETGRGTFVPAASLALQPWLDAPMPPTLCFSDTHLVPEEKAWADDAPEDLTALLRALPDHDVLVLGDLTEAIGVGREERAAFARSRRLRPVFDALADHRTILVAGNHDLPALDALERHLHPARVALGGYEHDRLRIRHGHEGESFVSAQAWLGPHVIPWYERARRLSKRPPERIDNRRVLARLGAPSSALLFGHTHAALLEPGAMNPGCFLGSAQSILTFSGYEAVLWRNDARGPRGPLTPHPEALAR